MAIGDAVAVYMGTAEVTRRPASGVEEMITGVVKPAAPDPPTDAIRVYDGSKQVSLTEAGGQSGALSSGATWLHGIYNLNIPITNGIYLRKTGTTDRIQISGVQVAT